MMQVGHAVAGSGPESAIVTTLIGGDETPAGAAFAVALASPSAGHPALLVNLREGLPIRPYTVLVSRSFLANEKMATLFEGPIQAGVAAGMMEAVARAAIPLGGADAWRAVVNVAIDPAATDAGALFENHKAALAAAATLGAVSKPVPEDVLGERANVSNRLWSPSGSPSQP
jgi:5,6,7,8-tetrahydromethanopterin hydro-lyase